MNRPDHSRPCPGPAILSHGFRPFFLLAAIYAAASVLAWLPVLQGELSLATAFSPRDWHVHEMLFGYLAAVIAGFLLTAIPNWTGRLPLRGRSLLLLVAAWIAGRAAVTFSAFLPWVAAAVLDTAFLVLLAAAAGREIVAGRNWNNLKVLAVLMVLIAANTLFHVEAHMTGHAAYATRLGVGAVLVLVTLIGGRIVPSFTRNWLVRENPGRLPVPFGRYDLAVTGATVAGLALWVAAPDITATGIGLLVVALMQAARLSRWAGDRTLRDPLVAILHVAYAFIPLGFVLLGAAILAPGLLPQSAGLHAWTGGAMGAMTLAVMSRASRGHTGRALVATPATRLVYLLVLVGALARIAAALPTSWGERLLVVAALCWSAAFIVFAVAYWRILTGPRLA